mgnify:CR=1 FL=1
MMPETISEGVREITLPNDPVEVDTEAWEADEIKALEADSPAEDAEDHVEQDEQVPIDAEVPADRRRISADGCFRSRRSR